MKEGKNSRAFNNKGPVSKVRIRYRFGIISISGFFAEVIFRFNVNLEILLNHEAKSWEVRHLSHGSFKNFVTIIISIIIFTRTESEGQLELFQIYKNIWKELQHYRTYIIKQHKIKLILIVLIHSPCSDLNPIN